jgi:hypothetical protein
VLLEAVAARIGITDQQRGGGLIGFEELERRPYGGAKRRDAVIGSRAQRAQRDRDVSPQGILLGGHQRVEQVVLGVEVPKTEP